MKINWFRKRKMVSLILCFFVISLLISSDNLYAKSEDNQYYMGRTQKKDDAGYGENAEIDSDDIHYGWELGQFCISGYTRRATKDSGHPVFLKNVGDTVALSFLLQQDIQMLNSNKKLHISEDTNGYDEYFNIMENQRTNFGYGTLLVKKTDYQNKITYIQPYKNYLEGVEKGANTKIQFLEEGDYEVALDYEIQENKLHLGKWRPFDDYRHYQILIKFSVRNGNCMVYLFDQDTKTELVNTSFVKNGFYIDMANSRYLTIDVKKQNYIKSEGSLVEDTRFNRPASDGEEFMEEGVYIITAKNKYTDAVTEKKIYVGADPVLKAYVTTGQEIGKIKEMVSQGAVIEDNGTITLASKKVIEKENQPPKPSSLEKKEENIQVEKVKSDVSNDVNKGYVLGGIVAGTFILLIIIIKIHKDKKRKVLDKVGEAQ